MSLDIGVTFIIERNKDTMNPYNSVYNEEIKEWEHIPTGQKLPKFEILSSAICNSLKELDCIAIFQGDYTSCPKELWDVLGINKQLKSDSNSYISPCRELFYSDLTNEESQLQHNIKDYQEELQMYSDILSDSTTEESYNLTLDNLHEQKQLISYCNTKLDYIKEFKAIWDYMSEEDKLHYSTDENNNYVKDKIRVVITYYN